MISVIVPFFNSSDYLEDCLDSIFKQSFVDLEVIVVDDGSTEVEHNLCQEIISKYDGAILYTKKNGGAASARNFGVEKSTYSYVAFLDSDDVWLESKLESQLSKLTASSVDIVVGNIIVADEELNEKYRASKKIPSTSHEIIKQFFLGTITMCTPTILMTRNLFINVGGFNEGLRYREDHFFLMNCVKKGGILLDSDFSTIRRERHNSLSAVSTVFEEIEKHQPFWELALNEFPFLDLNLARNKLLLSLGFFFLKRKQMSNVDDCIKLLRSNGQSKYIFLVLGKRLRFLSDCIFKLRDYIRYAK